MATNRGAHAYERGAYADKAHARRKKRKWTVVLVIAIVVLVCSLAALGAIAFSYWQGQQAYNRVTETASLDTSDEIDLNAANVDWDALRDVNPDIVAWIYIPNSNINYPVVKGADDSYYLTHDFEKTQGGITNNGCIFLHADNASDFSDQGSFLFGHHLNDGTMFSAISDEGAFQNQRTVYLLTPKVNMKLRSFSLVHCGANDPLLQTTFSTSADLRDYLRDIEERSVVDVDDAPDVSSIDQFVALSTCDNLISNGRYVLYCSVEQVGSPE